MTPSSLHTIRLFRTAQGWMSQHSDPEVRRLFGTDTLPTPFTATAAGADVLNAVVRLNPDRVVFLSPHPGSLLSLIA